MAEEPECPHCGKPVPPGTPGGLCPECLVKVGIGSEAGTAAGDPKRPRSPPPSPADIAPHFPQLEIIELLGSGGMGAVYKARQRGIDRLVALKILPSEAAGDPGFAERFTREARALAKLNHPSIVALYDFGHIHGLHYFIMEYVDGLNLRQLEQAGRLSPREALQIIPQICEALQFAHDEGIVHRDIKPENVLLDKKGRVKIADFGLARILGHEPEDFRLTRAREVMGTPHYMAPEQVEKPQTVDHRADIYSLGVVFYEMLTGELPLGRFAPPSQKVQIDVRLDDVVLRALEKEPARRYQQAHEVKTDMETILTQPPASTVGAAPTLTRSAIRQALSRRQAVVVAAAAVLILVAIGAVMVWKRASAARAEAQAAALEALLAQDKGNLADKPSQAAGFYYVSGEVRTPSRRPYDSRMTVLQAITSAGDFTVFADKEHVRLTSQDGRSQIVDCLKALDDPSLNPEVRPGDTVHVGRRLDLGTAPTTPASATAEYQAQAAQQAFARRYGLSPSAPSPATNAFAKRYFTVLGQVQHPGTYDLPTDGSVSLLQAIATAGGYTQFGNPHRIRVERTVNNAKTQMMLDAEAMAADKKHRPVVIQPDDVIVVGEPKDSTNGPPSDTPAPGAMTSAESQQRSGTIQESAKRYFTVLGQVQKPGTYDMPTDYSFSLLQAIAMAKGYTRLANPRRITVQRKVDTATQRIMLDASAMAEGKQSPLVIQPGDVIVVGEIMF